MMSLKPGSVVRCGFENMAARKTLKESQSSEGVQRDQAADKLRKRKELFIQQFEQEGWFPRSIINAVSTINKSLCVLRLNVCLVTAQERVNEMEAKLDKLLATLDRAVKIEMMKMPPSLQTTLIKDILSGRFTFFFFLSIKLYKPS